MSSLRACICAAYPNGIVSNTDLVEATGGQAVIVPGLNIYETTHRFLFRDALRTAELAYCDGELDPFQLSAVDEFLTIAISSEFEKRVLGLWKRTRDKVDLSFQQRTSPAVRRIVVDRIPRGYHL